MNAIVDLLSGPAWQHTALALLHTLWQGLAAAVLLWLLLRRIPADRPEARYCTALAVFMGLVFCGLVTWSVLGLDWMQSSASVNDGSMPSATESAARGDMPMGTLEARANGNPIAPVDERSTSSIGRPTWLAFVMAGWLLGVALMMMRMAWMVARLRRFARCPEVTDDRIRQMVDELRHALHVRRSLRIVETAEAFGPAVLGVVRSLLVLPVSMLTGLPPDAVLPILAHELAHVRRHDYLLNLVQMVTEAVLFFNPAVWWINRQIRIEREACCDAMAAGILGQPQAMAEALSLWAERILEQGGIRPPPLRVRAGRDHGCCSTGSAAWFFPATGRKCPSRRLAFWASSWRALPFWADWHAERRPSWTWQPRPSRPPSGWNASSRPSSNTRRPRPMPSRAQPHYRARFELPTASRSRREFRLRSMPTLGLQTGVELMAEFMVTLAPRRVLFRESAGRKDLALCRWCGRICTCPRRPDQREGGPVHLGHRVGL